MPMMPNSPHVGVLTPQSLNERGTNTALQKVGLYFYDKSPYQFVAGTPTPNPAPRGGELSKPAHLVFPPSQREGGRGMGLQAKSKGFCKAVRAVDIQVYPRS